VNDIPTSNFQLPNFQAAPGVSPAADLPRRDRLFIWIALLLVTVLAWAYLVHLGRQMSSSMTHDSMMAEMGMTMDMPWTATDVFFTFTMWAVMMIGMMTGTAVPMLLLFAATHAARGASRMPPAVLMFGLGYTVVWVAFSAGAALAQWMLHQAAMLTPAMAASNGWLAGGVLVAAGAYQLTPVKGACLIRCRSPLGFLMTNWRDGAIGALQMGLRHGVYCLGCCWLLMCLLFVVGVMNLVWVAALTAFVLVEKIGPFGLIVARAAGAIMIAFGILVIIAGVR
jgi:predicted metal-binding membrane protein